MFANARALLEYPKIRSAINKNRDLFFFFPMWSFGGAERVHIDILNLVKNKNPLCFITERSSNDGFRKEFENAAEVINLGRWSEKTAYKIHLLKKLSNVINKQEKPTVFGWGSRFMYELIPYLKPHVRILDLIHNFTDDGDGIEIFSLPYINRIEKRIVVGKAIINQFKELYRARQIPSTYLDRLVFIQNKVPFQNVRIEKTYGGPLKVIFVARNSPEKRPQVFVKVAQLCFQLNLPVEFEMIGDFESYQNIRTPNLHIIGEIHNKTALNHYYAHAHLLLLTSIRESWGLVIFEGMIFGVVPISTNVAELSDYISIEKQNGILLENLENEDSLVESFVRQITHFINNRMLLKTFSENANLTVKQLSSQNVFEKSYLDLFSDS